MKQDLFDITGKTALITGGHRGLGRGITEGFARAGVDVAVVSRTVGRDLVEELKPYHVCCRTYNYDLTDTGHLDELVARVTDDFGGIDILVNNAGMQYRCQAEAFPENEWHLIQSVNCDAVFFLCQKVGRQMLGKGYGKIINIASINSFQGRKYIAAYAASKGAVAQFSKTLANEWAGRGVNVNCIMPGFFTTEMTRELISDEGYSKELLSRIPAGRFGLPGDLAGAAIFLASSAADYINGHILCVDGGWMSA